MRISIYVYGNGKVPTYVVGMYARKKLNDDTLNNLDMQHTQTDTLGTVGR